MLTAFCTRSSTSREGHGGNAQSKSEIIMQTVLWGSIMTKVSLRCSCNSALEYQLGLSGTWSWKEVTGIVNAFHLSVGIAISQTVLNNKCWETSSKEGRENMVNMRQVCVFGNR